MSAYAIASTAMNLATIPVVVIHLLHYPTYQRAVPGSLEKYRASTVCFATAIILGLLAFGVAAINIMDERYGWATLNLIVSVIWFLDSRRYKDNWFNNQYKKLKRKVKNFARSLAPAPRLAPAYAR